MTIEPFAVTLKSFDPFVVVSKGIGNDYIYSKIEITVKNMDEEERYLKFTPTSAIVDDIGNQYMAISPGKSDEFKSGVIYSGVKKTGSIYFDPYITPLAKKMTLHLYLNDKKYLFVIKL